MPRLWVFIRAYRTRFFVSLGLIFSFTLVSISPPLVMQFLLDSVFRPRNWKLLGAAVAAMAGVRLSIALLRYFNGLNFMIMVRRILADMRRTLFRKVINLQMQFHYEYSSGMIVGRIMDDVNQVQRLFQAETLRAIMDIIVIVGAVAYLAIVNWKLLLIILVTITLYIVVYTVFSKRIERSMQDYRSIYDKIGGRLQETLSGVRHVRIFNQEEYENETFLNRTAESLERRMESRMGIIILTSTCHTIAGLGSAVVAGVGGYYAVKGEMTIGQVQATISYMWLALQPAIRLSQMAGQLLETLVSVRRIFELLDIEQKITSHPQAPAILAPRGKVSFNSVDFSYNKKERLFQNLDLTMEGGKTVAMVGHTGCGKTTLTSLMMRFWDVQGGSITIDGNDIRTVDLHSLRSLFGVVPQHPVVFEETVFANIAYGKKHTTTEEVVAAAKNAEIHDTIMALPNGYSTPIGTRGVKLSLGEKQRISIARAIVKNPRILILDEATSALDSESEEAIQKALETVLKDRTSVVVAHRLSTIVNADNILVMRHGSIIETGTHRKLLRIDGGEYRSFYSEMIARQTGDN